MCIINIAIEMSVPLKHTKSIPSKWQHRYRYIIRQMFIKRHAAWRARHILKTNKLHEKYVKLDTKCKQTVRNFEVNREQLIHNGNIGQFYTVGQKTAPFYFCNSFVKSFSIRISIGTHIP